MKKSYLFYCLRGEGCRKMNNMVYTVHGFSLHICIETHLAQSVQVKMLSSNNQMPSQAHCITGAKISGVTPSLVLVADVHYFNIHFVFSCAFISSFCRSDYILMFAFFFFLQNDIIVGQLGTVLMGWTCDPTNTGSISIIAHVVIGKAT